MSSPNAGHSRKKEDLNRGRSSLSPRNNSPGNLKEEIMVTGNKVLVTITMVMEGVTGGEGFKN